MVDQKIKEKQNAVYEKYNLDPQKIPKHIAVIMDGNGRWAKKRLMPRNYGHKKGAEALRATIKACVELGIEYLTCYVFSTENWKRPQGEVNFLMGLFEELIIKEIPELNKQGTRVRCLGKLETLPDELQNKIIWAEHETKNNKIFNLNLMLNYGAKDEISTATKLIAKDVLNEKIKLEDITENLIDKYLYTKDSPELDIMIRTGGDVRVSNYLLWQIAYSELFFLDILWPDFGRKKLIEIVQEFQKKERRFGGLLTS